MARPDRKPERRRELLPVVASTFAEHGYRRASTAELAERCGVRENVLYRLWPDKKAMFIAAIEFVFERSESTWREALNDGDVAPEDAAATLLAHEADHLGEHGLYRILFAGLGETDDDEIREALATTFGRFVDVVRRQIAAHRGVSPSRGGVAVERAAWALVGLGTIANIGNELDLLDEGGRRRLASAIGTVLLNA